MTTLLIDLGNTALKWCELGGESDPHTVVHKNESHCREALFEAWKSLRPTRVVGCTVAAPDLAFSATKFFNDHSIEWEWVRSQPCFENEIWRLENGYLNYKQLGSDRWNASVGALGVVTGKSLLVVHMGTATTVDSIVFEGEGIYKFIGGRISPGVTLMRSALGDCIPTLTRDIGLYQDFPDNSASAISSGIIDAQVGLVVRAMEKMKQYGPTQLILAGGAAKYMYPFIKEALPGVLMQHNLVLKGLAQRAKVLEGV